MNASMVMREYATKTDGKTCHGCDRFRDPPLKCGTCRLFWYCDKVSPTIHVHGLFE